MVAAVVLAGFVDPGFAHAALVLSDGAREVELTCAPDGGGHPDPVAACATLARYDVDPDRMTPAPTACFLVYAPVTARITGTWAGRSIRWEHRYGNGCEMHRATGVLFDF